MPSDRTVPVRDGFAFSDQVPADMPSAPSSVSPSARPVPAPLQSPAGPRQHVQGSWHLHVELETDLIHVPQAVAKKVLFR